MPTLTEEKLGIASASKTEQQPRWATKEDIEKFEGKLFKNYVLKKGASDTAFDLNEETANPKKFFYKILGMHPFTIGGVASGTTQFQIKFEVQKYHRGQFQDGTVRDENNAEVQRNVKVPKKVQGHEQNTSGLPYALENCLDANASFPMEANRFLTLFEPDAS